MKIDRTPNRKRLDDEGGEGDLETTEESGGPKLIRPQTFPTTPVPLSPGRKSLDDPFSITQEFRTQVDKEGNFSITIKKK